MKLLLELPVFIKSVNGSYLQVSGIAAGELAYKESQRKKQNLTKKRTRKDPDDSVAAHASSSSSSTAPVVNVESVKPSLSGGTTLARFRMLYNNRSTCWQGVPANHSFLKVLHDDLFALLSNLNYNFLLFLKC